MGGARIGSEGCSPVSLSSARHDPGCATILTALVNVRREHVLRLNPPKGCRSTCPALEGRPWLTPNCVIDEFGFVNFVNLSVRLGQLPLFGRPSTGVGTEDAVRG